MEDIVDQKRWDKIQDIFLEAALLPLELQATYVSQQTLGDPDLEIEVCRLLGGHHKRSVLDQDFKIIAAGVFEQAEVHQFESLGPYQLQTKLGAGGMGTVYMATRDDWQTKVALKMPRDIWISSDRLQRFAYEQLLLARLVHPSIARIYEGGTLPNGTPWFAMEYVDGKPINQYCQDQRLPVRDRLQLFLAVCDAVGYAHSQAIIHRDLKPSNILVTSAGEVKLLDFGIAKQLGEYAETVTMTAAGRHPVTLAYAAPEQMVKNNVSTRSDVYSLGVILYEMLTGKLPFDLSDLSPTEAEKMVTTREPEQPSVAARRNAAASVAGVEPSLSKATWSDLDALCMKAMNSVQDRRYPSVEALSNDIGRHLREEPLEAHPDRWFYKAGKYVRRNKSALITAAAVFAALAGLITYSTVRISRARDEAVRQANRSKLIESFLLSLFGGADDQAAPNQDLKVVTVLHSGELQADALRGDPILQSDLYQVLGSSYRKLGKLAEASSLLKKSFETRERLLGSDSPEVAKTLMERSLVEGDAAHFDQAERLARDALSIEERAKPANPEAQANAMTALGQILTERDHRQEAIKLLNEAVALQGKSKASLAEQSNTLNILVVAHTYAGDLNAAAETDRRLLTIDRQLYGETHPKYATDLSNMGTALFTRGNFAEAEAYYRKALAVFEGWYGMNHPDTAVNMIILANVLTSEKKLAEASALLAKALEIQTRLSSAPSPSLVLNLDKLGGVALARGQLEEAETYYTRALAMSRVVFGDRSARAGLEVSNLADVYSAQKDYSRAEQLYRQAFKEFSASFAPDNLNVGGIQIKIGHTLVEQRRYAEAEPILLRGYDVVVKQASPTMPWVTLGRRDLATVYERLHEPEKAAKFRNDVSRK